MRGKRKKIEGIVRKRKKNGSNEIEIKKEGMTAFK